MGSWLIASAIVKRLTEIGVSQPAVENGKLKVERQAMS